MVDADPRLGMSAVPEICEALEHHDVGVEVDEGLAQGAQVKELEEDIVHRVWIPQHARVGIVRSLEHAHVAEALEIPLQRGGQWPDDENGHGGLRIAALYGIHPHLAHEQVAD